MATGERRLRVCVVARATRAHGIGGVEDHVEDLVEGLARAGHEPVVITSRHPDVAATDLVSGVRRHYVDAPGSSFADPRWRLQSLAAFRVLTAEQPFDVVHGHGSSALELVRNHPRDGTPIVVTFHGNFRSIVSASLRRQRASRRPRDLLREQKGVLDLARRHYAHGNSWRFRSCEAIVPAQEQLVPTCRSHHLDPARVHVVPNGVDLDRFRPREGRACDAHDSRATPSFVFAGRLNRQKGIDDALRAFAVVRSAYGRGSFVVVGDGEDRDRLARIAAELGIAEHVRWTGAVTRDEVARRLAAADVFVFPSRHNEAAPLAVRQAMASGLPVVATRVGSIPELVAGCGIVVGPGDVAALAAAMSSLLHDPGLAGRLGAAGREVAVAHYGLDSQIAATIGVYRTAIDRQRVAA